MNYRNNFIVATNSRDVRVGNLYRHALDKIKSRAILYVTFTNQNSPYQSDYLTLRMSHIPIVQNQLNGRTRFRFSCKNKNDFSTDDIEGLPVPTRIPIVPMRPEVDELEGFVHLVELDGSINSAWKPFSIRKLYSKDGLYYLEVGNVGMYTDEEMTELVAAAVEETIKDPGSDFFQLLIPDSMRVPEKSELR